VPALRHKWHKWHKGMRQFIHLVLHQAHALTPTIEMGKRIAKTQTTMSSPKPAERNETSRKTQHLLWRAVAVEPVLRCATYYATCFAAEYLLFYRRTLDGQRRCDLSSQQESQPSRQVHTCRRSYNDFCKKGVLLQKLPITTMLIFPVENVAS
jgi:hypothetical protein